VSDDPQRTAAFERVERPVFSLDGEWRFAFVNDRARRLLGNGRPLEGRVIWDVLPGVMDTDLPGTFHDARTSGETRRTTVPLRDDRRVEFQVFPGEGGLSVLLEDVTERHRQRQQRRRYEAAFSAADDPIYVLDEAGRIREVNEALLSLTGYEESELLGERMSVLLDDDELDRAERRIREAVVEGDQSVGTVETEIRTAGGRRRTCAINVAVLPDEGGISGSVGVMRDVTDRRQREQRLSVLDRVLRHNIRNEMNVVMGRARIAEGQADEEVSEHLRRILAKAESLVEVSQAVRRFADAIDPGLGSAQPRDAAESVKLIVEDLREEHPDAEVRLVIREPAWMRAHESVFTAVEELVRNGIEHAETESPTVDVTVDARGRPDRGRVEIEVADEGPGLPTAEREVLTEGAETQLDHASGIGLWLVNWAITKSGGELSFRENDPRGSVITVELPRAAPPGEGDEGESSGSDSGGIDARPDGGG
jgi:PAS domain S-box-containing protein